MSIRQTIHVRPNRAPPVRHEQCATALILLLDRRYEKFPHTKGWRVVDPTSGQVMPRWHQSVAERFAWAQREGLLPGQRPRALFEHATVNLRHRAAHPASYSFGSPNDAALAISDLAETPTLS